MTAITNLMSPKNFKDAAVELTVGKGMSFSAFIWLIMIEQLVRWD